MGDQSSYIDDFWLPEFKLNACYTDEAGFSNEMMVSTDYRTKLQSLTRRSKTKAKVIKPPFVFGNCFRLIQDSSTRSYSRCSKFPFSALSSPRIISWLVDDRLYTVEYYQSVHGVLQEVRSVLMLLPRGLQLCMLRGLLVVCGSTGPRRALLLRVLLDSVLANMHRV